MKRIAGILLTSFLVLSFFGITTYAATPSKINQEKQHELSFENATLIDSKIDKKTGVKIDVYGSNEPIPSNKSISSFAALSSGNGNWDPLGGEIWVMNGNINSWQKDGVYNSNGGDYALVIPPHEMDYQVSGYKPIIEIKLWEDDPAGDDYVGYTYVQGPVYFNNYYIAFRDIGSYVDGINDKAEFYTTHATNYTVLDQSLFVQYFD